MFLLLDRCPSHNLLFFFTYFLRFFFFFFNYVILLLGLGAFTVDVGLFLLFNLVTLVFTLSILFFVETAPLHHSKRSECCTLDLFPNAEATSQRQFELIFNTCREQILLENVHVPFLVEDNELRFRKGNDAVDPHVDVRVG